MARASTKTTPKASDKTSDKASDKASAKSTAKSVTRATAASSLNTPTDLSQGAVAAISEALNACLADSFALYLKTKNFHWHVSGPHFRDYHLMFDEQSGDIIGVTDELAERVRKIGGTTLRSISHISKLQSIADNDAPFVSAADMLGELVADNKAMVTTLRRAHDVADEYNDSATASLLENIIDATEKRVWFLFESSRPADHSGH